MAHLGTQSAGIWPSSGWYGPLLGKRTWRARYGWVASGVLSLLGLAACTSELLSGPGLDDQEPSAGAGGNAELDGGRDNGGGGLTDAGAVAGGGVVNAGSGDAGRVTSDMGGEGGNVGTSAGLTNRTSRLAFSSPNLRRPDGRLLHQCPLRHLSSRTMDAPALSPAMSGGFDAVLVAFGRLNRRNVEPRARGAITIASRTRRSLSTRTIGGSQTAFGSTRRRRCSWSTNGRLRG